MEVQEIRAKEHELLKEKKSIRTQMKVCNSNNKHTHTYRVRNTRNDLRGEQSKKASKE